MGAHARLAPAVRGQATRLLDDALVSCAARAVHRAREEELGVDDDAKAGLPCWEYLGSGYLNPGAARLASSLVPSRP
jgi:hypothetical protein